MRPASPELLATVRGSHQVTGRARIVPQFHTGPDPDGVEVEVIAGDVTADATADVRATCDVTLVAGDWRGQPGDLVTPYGSELFLEAGVIVGGGTEWVPLGYYRVDSVDEGDAGGTLRVAGSDRMAALVDAKLMHPWQFLAGHNFSTVFDRLVHDAMPDAAIRYESRTLADENLGRDMVAAGEDSDTDNDRYAFLDDLATSHGRAMFFDANGVLRIEALAETGAPVATLDAGPGGVLVSAPRSLNRRGMWNAVVATGEGADDKDPVRAVAKDMHPQSPTYWHGRFGHVPHFYTSSKITVESQARDAAAAQLLHGIGLPYEVDIAAVPNPTLDAGDPVTVAYRDGDTKTLRLQRVTTGLTPDDRWHADAREQTYTRIEVM